ncbi:MAG: hypothetical protein IJ745_08430 [Bacteroidales bacterium]|nr:hypothetical protein [Bacteroidales bacterium]
MTDLRDTCLTAQDNYIALHDYFKMKYRQGYSGLSRRAYFLVSTSSIMP